MKERPRRRRIDFTLEDCPEQLDAFAQRFGDAVADARGRAFAPPDVAGRLVLPPLASPAEPGEPIGDYARRVAPPCERFVVLLLRAGAVALGYWDGDELLDHKAIRKYVVRGRGRAQPTHLRTKGKSRYGSRLRLQNWRSLLVQTNERLRDWWLLQGTPERVFLAAPVRAFADLRDADPSPPFVDDLGRIQRIPFHVHRPDHAELLHVRARLAAGTLELMESGG